MTGSAETLHVADFISGPRVLVPASGASTRFGRPKLLEPVDGVPMIVRTCRAIRAGGGGDLLIAVRPSDRTLAEPLSGLASVLFIDNPEWERGMAASYQLLIRYLSPDEPFVLACPADVPFVKPSTVRSVIEAAAEERSRLIIPTFGGRPGHPVAVPIPLLRRAGELSGDEGFRRWRNEAWFVDTEDPGCVHDVDRPEDLTR